MEQLRTPNKTKTRIQSCSLEDELEVMLAEEIERNEALFIKLEAANREIQLLKSAAESIPTATYVTNKRSPSISNEAISNEAIVIFIILLLGFDFFSSNWLQSFYFAIFAFVTIISYMMATKKTMKL